MTYHEWTDQLNDGSGSLCLVERYLPPIADRLAQAVAQVPGVDRVEIGLRHVSVWKKYHYSRSMVERRVSMALMEVLR